MLNILDTGLYILKDLVISATLIVICIYILKGKFKKNVPAITTLSILNIINAIIGVYILSKYTTAASDFEYDEIMDIFSVFIQLLSVTVLIKEINFSKKFAVYIICVSTIDMIYSIIAPFISEHLYLECLIIILIYGSLLSFIYYIIKVSPVNILPEVFDQIPKRMIIILFIFDFSCYYKQFGDYSSIYNLLFAFSSIGVILCALFFVYKIFSLTYQQTEILKQMQSQKEYSEKMLKGDENLRKFRHDYRNHMIVINALLENGSTDRARDYINAMNSDINDTVNKISTGNFIADALLNNKAVVAAQSGNKIKFSGQIPAEGIADDDVCTILANALDNAIEATNKLEAGQTINVEAAVRNNHFILNITNPVSENVKIGKNNTLKTTKKNANEHGIGTKNIQRVVKKYNGALMLGCENKVFSFSVRLNLQNN